jgi:hypothetical protein
VGVWVIYRAAITAKRPAPMAPPTAPAWRTPAALVLIGVAAAEADEAVAAGVDEPADEAIMDEPDMEPLAMELAPEAALVAVAALEAGVLAAGAAVAAQAHTAEAEAMTTWAVWIPQAEMTQVCAPALMAADWELEHWQLKSVSAHPTLEAAAAIQETAHVGTLAATPTQPA